MKFTHSKQITNNMTITCNCLKPGMKIDTENDISQHEMPASKAFFFTLSSTCILSRGKLDFSF